jgi:CheY-like chemotaxis protein
MRSLNDPERPQGNVMIVDDNPANLKLLDDMLRQHGYEVQAFPRGRLALAAAAQEPPDLILLDINMPEMNGYEVCEHLKSSARLADIPVIFLSALNAVEDKVKGFASGAVDYISKPFQFEEVQVRVQTHLRLRRAQQAEHDLLEQTLGGAVGTLWGLVQLISPTLTSRSDAVREIVLRMTKRLGFENSWQYELAATLCFLGCIALPDDVFDRGYRGQTLSPDEERMFRAHPQSAARLLAKIPRMEVVAEIVRRQQNPKAKEPGPEPPASEQAMLGAHVIHLALELDRRIYRGMPSETALVELGFGGRFDAGMLNALEGYSPAGVEFEVRQLSLRELRPGMILDRSISGAGGLLILKVGTVLTQTWIERLRNFASTEGQREPTCVRIPRIADVQSLPGAGPGAPAATQPRA